jgi:putative membrane-bound dehydrogenase-like protein
MYLTKAIYRLVPSLVGLLLVLSIGPPAPGQASRIMVAGQLDASRTLYTTPQLWALRRAALREGFLKGARLWPLPERTPLNPIVHDRREHDGYTVENVALETMPGFYLTGNLYRPSPPLRRGPAVLCPHGHFQPLGRFRAEQQIRCAHLARMGATVFSYGMVGWQDSTQTTHDDPLVLALQTWNSIRAIDFVTGLEGVDPERVAVTGASGGGSQTVFVTLVDDRVKVSAPVVIVYPWNERDGCRCEGGLPVMRPMQTNAIELAAAAAPRPQLLISAGRDDPTHDFPQVGFPFIRHVYEMLGHGGAVANVHLANEGHDYGPSKRRALYAFFARHLGLELQVEDPTKITIEPPELLRVFDEQHPLPRHAIHGSAAVARVFEGLARRPVPSSSPKAMRIESSLFTPSGFDREGHAAVASGAGAGKLKLTVRDGRTGRPTCCRVNVVGADGNFYQPPPDDLTPYALTGQWPRAGRGNREGKAPVRYFGRFFYSHGEATVDVPAGPVRVEVWKGIEYRPQSLSTQVAAGRTQAVELTLTAPRMMADLGIYSGDPHLHLPRRTDADDARILDLLEAEDVHYGSILAYNEPAGPYAGFMDRLDTPQLRGLGEKSISRRGAYQIMSGQEYRSGTYGHLNLYLRDDLVLQGGQTNADRWPIYGNLGRETQRRGGYAFYAHGGYAQAIYADFVQGNVNGVELLQFGVYRGISLEDWYRILNCGFHFPCVAASDYPACRKLADCVTYIYHDGPPTFAEWFRAAAEGRSFVTTGPLVLLEVDGNKPGAILRKDGPGPHTVTARVRVSCEVAPVTNVQLVVGGKVVRELTVPADHGKGNVIELAEPVELKASSWIAARAYSRSPSGEPDAEAHTNPVHVSINGKAPYDAASLDVLLRRLDGQIAVHRRRNFPEKLRVLEYFERSRDRLLRIRQAGGLAAAAPAFDPSRRTHTDEELRQFLLPIPPRPPAEALKTFETVGGFYLELVAAEPLVYSPVAAAFDENGRLYVAEMRDYPYRPNPGQAPIGRIRLLEDTKGTGIFDKSTVFADHLMWPAGVVPWKGGVFVTAPPDIWYFKDTDGDGKADVCERVFTGFGTQNEQGMLNNLVFGLDHKIYGSASVNGGTVQIVRTPSPPTSLPGGEGRGIRVDGKDFRFDPVTHRFETVTGTLQFGVAFDDWGNRFLCTESGPLFHVVLPQRYLARNPYLPVPAAINNLAPAPVPIYRISPVERWRMIRSARRITYGERPATAPGASHHVVDAGCGVVIYRGGAYPPEYYGNAFTCDAQNNLVHRRRLVPDGATFQSLRANDRTEFLRSSDNWFRPVNLLNAPDGTLYVLDMSREILEAIHIPLDVARHLDLTRGRDHGRIYRIAPPGFRYPDPPRLGRATGAELVAALESPHGWWRDTAHRLIFERQDRSMTGPLRALLLHSTRPPARVYALWSLEGLGTLDGADLLAGLADPTPGVRRHAVRLAESRLNDSPSLRKQVIALADDPDSGVRFQVVFTLGEVHDPDAAAALARLAQRHAADAWMRTAVLSSVAESAPGVLTTLLADTAFLRSPQGSAILEQLALVVGVRNRPAEVRQVLDALATAGELQARLLLSLGDGLKRGGARLTVPKSPTRPGERLQADRFAEALHDARDSAQAVPRRCQAVRLLACYPADRTRSVLAALLDTHEPVEVQLAAVRALADQGETDTAALLLRGWPEHMPAVRSAILQALLAREAWTLALLQAADQHAVNLAELDLPRRDLLLRHRRPSVAALARKLFGESRPGLRPEVIAQYQSVLKQPGDVARGRLVFRQHCMACHQIAGEGHMVGPDLTSSANRDAATLLTHILDPNLYVPPNYVQYLVSDRNGRTVAGLIAAETATSITLRREEGVEETILRGNIDELASTGKSLMPEGFEKLIDRRQMADLLAFLLDAQNRSPGRPLDIGTEPGLVEPERKR